MRLSIWPWRLLPLCLAAAAAAIAGCGSRPTGTVSVPGGPGGHTQQVHVSPVTSAGAAVSGYRVTSRVSGAICEPGSEAIGHAYRCSAGNYLYDPCWAEKAAGPAVLCVASPWEHTAVELRVTAPLPAIPDPPAGPGEPWGVQLATGQRCNLAQGAHNVFRGQVIDYYCPSGLALLRGLNRAEPVWTARSVLAKSGQLASGPAEKIAIAWYGTPAR